MNTITRARLINKERHASVDVGKTHLDIFIFEFDLHCQKGNIPQTIGGYERHFVEACAERLLPVTG